MGRFRLRRVFRVNSETLMIAVGQNLKRRLAKMGLGQACVPIGSRLCLLVGYCLVVDSSFSDLSG